ncbi:hypothetical protein Pmar_PMAR009173 [Perkinsus marinus ATCC 50983]|uniref:Uncharacterized protein n=1 Tax=Perkinsus marinus (strain ATCC 50983 / TXsc) TaxID=423536 RepID=C5KBM5_PERM5|nr:hypothetical protein Pmar_PMAR009173 [Perkinsus marinus ATCC 50983]EER18145.1 hypothetical protein Pmar_PMAR009173 [Perkinsus marinus ATCC 50983]|eukprot:XP_002786349.1 hypothetical protein Pmar_PMAR009173 [Perkinsus marinus ATCC 50983]
MATPDELQTLRQARTRARQSRTRAFTRLSDVRERIKNLCTNDEDDENVLAVLEAQEEELARAYVEADQQATAAERAYEEATSTSPPTTPLLTPAGSTGFNVQGDSSNLLRRNDGSAANTSSFRQPDFPEAPTRRAATRCTAAEVTKLVLPNLIDSAYLKVHYDDVEDTLVEAGAATRSTSGPIQVNPEVRRSVMTKFIGTLTNSEVKPVHQAAQSAARTGRSDWNHVRQLLLGRFCRRSQLKSKYLEKLSSLKFQSARQIDQYLLAASEAYFIFCDIYHNDSAERRNLTRQIIGRLPPAIVEKVIHRIRRYADHDDDSEDWETLLDFENATGDKPSVCDVIRSICRTSDEATIICQPTTHKADNIRSVVEPAQASSSRTLAQRPNSGSAPISRPTLSEWAKTFPAVYYITGRAVRNQEEALKILRADETKVLRNRRGFRYILAAYNDATTAKSIMSELDKENYRWREFAATPPSTSSSERTPAPLVDASAGF